MYINTIMMYHDSLKEDSFTFVTLYLSKMITFAILLILFKIVIKV